MQQATMHQGTLHILGVRVDNVDFKNASETVRRMLSHNGSGAPRTVFFTNAHTIHLARRDPGFLQIINSADAVFPDGSGLKLAGKVLRTPIIENLNGTDFTPKILEEAVQKGWSVYLLGGQQHVVDRCRAGLLEKLPGLRIVGAYHGHFAPEDEEEIVGDINANTPDILLVALGSPLQEKWIVENAPRLKVKVCFGVGGLFDFLAGERKRAPLWMRRLGLEWVYRFFQDPKSKWNRIFIEIPLFIGVVLVKGYLPPNVQRMLLRRQVVL